MQEQNQHSLQNGSIINHYRIIRVLGAGGFGITYLAEDIQLGMEVVLKEYFPNEFAIRNGDSTIVSKTASDNDFTKGMQRFKEEAQVLAKFNHPSIVKILGFFEANNTAYFVMEYEEGIDLSQYLKQINRTLTQEEVIDIIMPILEGLKEVHKYNYLHRDIKPGNILLRKNHSPVLIDFGASKLAMGEASKSVTSMLTEGYAPLEQYSTDIKQQGPFTDLYAVGAVIYKMITGKVPPSAQTRSYALLQDDRDPYVFLMNLRPTGFDDNFLMSIDKVLSVKAKDRQQDVSEFQADIIGKETKAQKETMNQEVSDNEPSGLGGWLALLGFGLLISPLTLFVQLSNQFKGMFEPGIWRAITTPGTDNYIPLFASAIFIENIGNIFIMLLSLYLIYLYFSKKENFPTWYIYASIGTLIFILIDAYAGTLLFPNLTMWDQETTKTVVRSIVGGIIWISYLLVSKRVKNTFVKKKNSDLKVLGSMFIVSIIFAISIYVFLENYSRLNESQNTSVSKVEQSTAIISKEKIEVKKPNKNNAKQLMDLGYNYWNGEGVEKNDAKAFSYFFKAAKLGDPEAETNVGVMYKNGWGVKQDYRQAKEWLEKASNKDVATAQQALGEMYQYGKGVLKDEYKAFDLYLKAAKQGNGGAQNALANMYAAGRGTVKDRNKAIQWYEKSANTGNAWGQNNLAAYYKYGVEVNKDLKKAFSLYKKAAKQNNATAQYNLAKMYENGVGTIKDQAKAVKWYEKAANNGNDKAQVELGLNYEFGLLGLKKNLKKAKSFYEKAAEKDNPDAQTGLGVIYANEEDYFTAAKWHKKAAKQGSNISQNALGKLYYSGKGVTQDYYKAFDYYKKSSAQGNEYAERSLAYMYLNGKGTIKSPKKAYEIYIKYARKDNLRSMQEVAFMYEKGIGIKKDSKKAVYWYKKAAEKNDAWAQKQLGNMYFNGKGVKKNMKNAVKWWRKSAKNGNSDAQSTMGYAYYYGAAGLKKSKKNAAYWMKKAYDNGNKDAKKKWNEWKLWKYE